jgi:hypothetical protein
MTQQPQFHPISMLPIYTKKFSTAVYGLISKMSGNSTRMLMRTA